MDAIADVGILLPLGAFVVAMVGAIRTVPRDAAIAFILPSRYR